METNPRSEPSSKRSGISCCITPPSPVYSPSKGTTNDESIDLEFPPEEQTRSRKVKPSDFLSELPENRSFDRQIAKQDFLCSLSGLLSSLLGPFAILFFFVPSRISKNRRRKTFFGMGLIFGYFILSLAVYVLVKVNW